MSATVFSTAQFGVSSETSSTGLVASDWSMEVSAENAYVENHVGTVAGMSLFNQVGNVTISGVIAVGATGLTKKIGDAVTLANIATGTSGTFARSFFGTLNGSASLIITQSSITRNNKGFETGSLNAVFHPSLATSSPSVIS